VVDGGVLRADGRRTQVGVVGAEQQGAVQAVAGAQRSAHAGGLPGQLVQVGPLAALAGTEEAQRLRRLLIGDLAELSGEEHERAALVAGNRPPLLPNHTIKHGQPTGWRIPEKGDETMWPRVNGMRAMELGTPDDMRVELNALVMAGRKTATTGLLEDYTKETERLEYLGEKMALLDNDGQSIGVIEITHVGVKPFIDVTWEHAASEGEGHASLEEWRAGP
jgi:uncharacterized protein YhfF